MHITPVSAQGRQSCTTFCVRWNAEWHKSVG